MGLFDDLLPAQSAGPSAIPTVGRALLDTIAGSESPGYNTLYGGGQFEGFTDHPRQAIPITSGPNAGRTSSAAGRYQFLAPTWDEVKREANLPDFSPDSQDQGAWYLAQRTYKQRTGRDLTADLEKAQGNPAAIKSIGSYLSGVWTSLPGGIEPNRATGSFAERYASASAPTELSSQSRRIGLFDDLLAATSQTPETSPPDTAALSDTGGRFSDNPGQNFRTAREGESPAVATGKQAFGGGVLKGASFNFVDEIAGNLAAGGYDPQNPVSVNNATALVRGLWRRATGDSEAEAAYRVTTSAVRDALERQREQQPVASVAGELTGGLATAPATGGLGTVARGAPLLSRAIAGAKSGAAYGALSGAGEGTDAESRTTGAVTGGLIGGAIGAPLGAVLPAGRAAAGMPAALEANLAAQRIGVDLPRAIATDSPTQRLLGQVANKMPGGGPMQNRVANAIEQTGEAVGEGAAKAGGTADAMAAGQGFRDAVENYFKPAVKSRVGAAYDAVENQLNANLTRPLTETQAAAADIMARRQAANLADPLGGAVGAVKNAITNPNGLTYSGVKGLRTSIGEMLDTGILPQGTSEAELRRIYGALSDDLKATVQAAGGQPAMVAFDRANAMAKQVADWKDNLRKVVGNNAQSGESITNSILRMAQDKGGDLKALTMARAAVPKDAWQDIATTAVSRLGLDRKGEFSPAIFLNDFSKLSDRGKRLLFDGIGSGDLLPHLNDIAKVSQKFIEAGKLANTSGTAGHSAAWAALTGIGVGAFVEPMTALTIAGGVAGNNIMARALSRPASAASIASWTRSYNNLVNAGPTAPAIAAFRRASINLSNTIEGQTGVRIAPENIMRSIQAPTGSRADQDQVPRPPGQ